MNAMTEPKLFKLDDRELVNFQTHPSKLAPPDRGINAQVVEYEYVKLYLCSEPRSVPTHHHVIAMHA
jgi:hypothetical protein